MQEVYCKVRDLMRNDNVNNRTIEDDQSADQYSERMINERVSCCSKFGERKNNESGKRFAMKPVTMENRKKENK
jgi:hypothetical protein